jgi:UPF0755 protein
VEVAQGDSVRAIGETLLEADVVASVEAFVDAAAAEPDATGIQPGQYDLQRQMPAAEALAVMVDPASRQVVQVTLREGRTLEQSLDDLAEATGLPRKQLATVAAEPQGLGLPSWSRARLEGFVFPATYELDRDVTAKDALAATVARFEQAADDVDLAAGAKRVGRTPYEVLVVASLVEAEAARPQDRPKMARAIYNRLAQGRRLQIDATVNYANRKAGHVPTLAETRVRSPYNTYVVAGLPPGPINSPGEASLRAALEPAEGSWIFWTTVDLETGETKFATTEAERAPHVAELRRWQAANR